MLTFAIVPTCQYLPFHPGTLLAKRFPPSRTIACGALIWACAGTGQAGVTSPAGLYVGRLFVGVGEACFG